MKPNNSDSRNIVEQVREHNDIVNVISQHIDIDRHNKGLCPFHDDDKTRSFSIKPGSEFFRCFGCGEKGDVFDFLKKREGKTFMEVLTELAEQAGISVTSLTPEDRQRLEDERTVMDIRTEAAKYYRQNIPPEIRAYLINERGFTGETITEFSIGYAAGGLMEYLVHEHEFPIELCMKAGVLKEDPEGHVVDFFDKRIIFPNFYKGQVVHLTGRSLENEPKYLHIPGKISHLFNEDALLAKEVFLVEGIPDCLTLIQAGFEAVAIYGSVSLKPDYVTRFSGCETVYLCLDADDAGDKGVIKAGELLGEKAKIVQLPRGADVNEYFRDHNRDDFEELIQASESFIMYQVGLIPSDTDKTELPRMLEPIIMQLARMDSAMAESYLCRKIKPYFGLNNKEIDGYREMSKKLRRDEAKAHDVKVAGSESKPVYTASFDGLVDLVEKDGKPAFLVKHEHDLRVQFDMEIDGILYLPPQLRQIPWLLPRADQVLQYYGLRDGMSQAEKDEMLFDALVSYHKSVSELPGEQFYGLIAAYDIHTYLLDNAHFSPIIYFFAIPERGKSRTGKGIINVAYRGIHVESLREAYLLRVARDYGSAIFFDVMEIWEKARKNNSIDILLNRFEKGAKVPRVLYPDRGPFVPAGLKVEHVAV